MSVMAMGAEKLSTQGVRGLLDRANLTVGGPEPWDPQVNDQRFFTMVVKDGMRGLGDAYICGYWDCRDLPEFFCRAIRAGLLELMAEAGPMQRLVSRFITENLQSPSLAAGNVAAHYDRHDRLVRFSVDGETRAYTCAVWKDPGDLDSGETLSGAQERKFGYICRALGLKSGMKVADLGCGYGGFMAYAAKRYGVEIVGYNISKEQCAYIRGEYGGLQNLQVVEDDWRELRGSFDRIVTIGMGEHVGRGNLRALMETLSRHLAEDGLAFTHFFGLPHGGIPLIDPWTEAHIFPGIDMLSPPQVAEAADGLFVAVDSREIGMHYPKTLWHWARNFRSRSEEILRDHGPEAYRMWWYYLNTAIAAFRTRRLILHQTVWAPWSSETLYRRTELEL